MRQAALRDRAGARRPCGAQRRNRRLLDPATASLDLHALLPAVQQRGVARHAISVEHRGGDPLTVAMEAVLRSAVLAAAALFGSLLLALPLREAREQFERAYLQQQLLLCNGTVGQLAKRVGMERTHLYRKLRSLGVDFRQLAED